MKLRCIMKAYIAGALFSKGERIFLEEIAKICKEIGLETFLPHRDAGLGEDVEEIFKKDFSGLDKCDVLVAVLNGSDLDSGTAWEIGYAYSRKKKIIGIIDDIRISKDRLNVMIANSVEIVDSIDELKGRLIEIKNG